MGRIRAGRIPPNSRESVPHRIIYLDAEAVSERRDGQEDQRFRLAATITETRDETGVVIDQSLAEIHLNLDCLWDAVRAFLRSETPTYLFAHNLAYDVRITDALTRLAARGFEVGRLAISDWSCWFHLARKRTSLWLCDSSSYVPIALGGIYPRGGIARPALPNPRDTMATWAARCVNDVETLARAMGEVIDWWGASGGGEWQRTGPALGAAHLRHRLLRSPAPKVHRDPVGHALEREAIYCGRDEAWRHGDIAGPLLEWDYRAAYASIVRDHDAPLSRLAPYRAPHLRYALSGRDDVETLGLYEVDTPVPIVPTRHDGRILWPVGRFRSVLWGCEARLAAKADATLRCLSLTPYATGGALRPWGEWVTRVLEDGDPDMPAPVRAMVKSWSRSVLGRLAAQWDDWRPLGELPDWRVAIWDGVDHDTGARLRYRQLGHAVQEARGTAPSGYYCPQVWSWVCAMARCQLWHAMAEAGHHNLVAVKTDGLVVMPEGSRRLQAATARGQLDGLRPKREIDDMRVFATRQAIVDDQHEIIGVPRRAVMTGPASWRGEAWEGLAVALGNGRPDAVRIDERTFRLTPGRDRREHAPDGLTRPHRLPTDLGRATATA